MQQTDHPVFIKNPESKAKKEGSNVTFSCNATGNPAPTFSWTKDGLAITSSDNPRISLSLNNKKLTITNLTKTDGGEYTCVATNSVKTIKSNAATLSVQCK